MDASRPGSRDVASGDEGTPPRSKSPFVPIDAICPVCGARVRNWSLRKSMFEVVESDLAGNPVRVKWNEAEWQWVRPMDYALWFCPACHLADLPKTFQDEKARGKHFDAFQEAVRAQASKPQAPLGLIGRAVDQGESHLSPSAAFLITLAGLLGHLAVKPGYRDPERMAHLYLRATAYLGEREPVDRLDPRVLLLLEHVRKQAPELPADAADAARRAMEQLDTICRTAREMDPRREVWLLKLIASLARSGGDAAEGAAAARRCFERTLVLRNETRERLQKQRGLVGGARDKVENLLEWLGHQSDEARDLQQSCLEEVVAVELPRLQERLRDHVGPIGEDLARELLGEGFREVTIRRYTPR